MAMSNEFPSQEDLIINRYELDFRIDQNKVGVKRCGVISPCLTAAGVVLLEVSAELPHADSTMFNIGKFGTFGTGLLSVGLGVFAIAAGVQDYFQYRRDLREVPREY